MNEISCDVCMDLIPLVKDGIASVDSQKAVELHMQNCEECRAVFGGKMSPVVNGEKAFIKMKRQVQIFLAMCMMFGIFFGTSLTGGNDLFYNVLIMPVIGGLGYSIFRWKALYTVPVLLLVTNVVTNFLGLIRDREIMDLYSLLMWTFFYSIFAWLGVIIGGLLHFAFRRDE